MNIGKASKLSDLTVKATRYYANIDLVKPKQDSQTGYRNYTQEDVLKLKFIGKARSFNFSIDECRAMGVDMFDCVMPSRNARHGMLFTSEGIINIKNKKWEKDFSPLDPNGTSYVDTTYSKAYLRHLIRAKENLAIQIATIHNLSFYLWLVKEARKHILDGTFVAWKNQMVPKLGNRL